MTQQMAIPDAMELAQKHHKARRLVEAESICRQILGAQPKNDQALHLLGMIASEVGQPGHAINLINQAIEVNPESADYYCSLGNALLSSSRFEDAAMVYRRSLAHRPHCSDAFNGLGYALYAQRHFDEAIASLHLAIELEPDFAEAHNNLGIALAAKREYEPAIKAFREALRHRPDYAEAELNLGSALSGMGKLDEAIESFERAAKLRPQLPEIHNNLAGTFEQQGKYENAIASYRHALLLQPNNSLVHFNLGVTLLRTGDFAQGWREYEWRLMDDSESSQLARNLNARRWDGGNLNGQRILLYAEQGLGDTIHFARYIPLVAQRGGRVILRCQTEVASLLKNLDGLESILTPVDPLPTVSVHCPLLSLPLVFATTIQSIPNQVPYIQADPERAEKWRARLGRLDARMKIGLVWAGRAEYRGDEQRSMPLSTLAPLARIEGAHFFSLQKGPGAMQAKTPPAGMTFTDWSAELHDFSDTAALIENLDMVICVDTAVAHLAGAMGKPVWVLLPLLPDWRWMLNRSDSPWYPTMKLFPQTQPRDWNEPIEQIVAALHG